MAMTRDMVRTYSVRGSGLANAFELSATRTEVSRRTSVVDIATQTEGGRGICHIVAIDALVFECLLSAAAR